MQELTILHYLIIVNFQNVIYSCEFEYFILLMNKSEKIENYSRI